LLLKWPTQRKRMPTTCPPPAYLLSTTPSKDVRFPGGTRYIGKIFCLNFLNCRCLSAVLLSERV
jgi:hypothetical protein